MRARAPVGRAIVVGASSGIGAALVRRLAREDWNVVALARRERELGELARELDLEPLTTGRVRVRVHDASRADEVPRLFRESKDELGGVDLLIYAAGLLETDAPDRYDTGGDLSMVDVNLCGAIAWCNAAALDFQARRAGTIVGISSVAGDRGRKLRPVYGATKAALNAYLDSLRYRLHPAGVDVCTIRPGHVDTAMTRGMRTLWPISADEAARQILAAVRARAAIRYVPRRWALVALALRVMPKAVMRRLEF